MVVEENTVQEKLVDLTVGGAVATITLTQPKKLNALNEPLLVQLDQAVSSVEKRDDVRVVLIRGEGRAFAAGADIGAMSKMDPIAANRFTRFAQAVFTRIEKLPQVTVALVQGYALGGGNELAMSADLRVAAEGTKFGQPEVGLGILPSFGGTQRLARLVGEGRALWMILLGNPIDAVEAERIGLVSEVVPADQLEKRGHEIADRLLALAPFALQVAKRSVYTGERLTIEDGLAYEATQFALCFATQDQKEGMSAFLEKRKAAFIGK